MAIENKRMQQLRGKTEDFDPTKLLAGEWAVTVDSDRRSQKIYMCIAPGIVKQMGTYEDFEDMIADATDSIKQQYIATFNEIKAEIEADKAQVHTEYTYTVNFKSQLDNTYLPSIQASQEAAAESELNAAESEAGASTSAVNAADAEQKAKDYAAAAKTAADSIVGALKPKGTITFALLPTTEIAEGDMYNISDEFTSDNRFKDGGDIQYPAGTNVYCTSDGMWDCLAGDMAGYVMEVDFDETLENSMPTYPAAEELAEPVAGEKFSVFLGKVKKAITSLMSTITTLTNYITATNETLAQLNSDLVKYANWELLWGDNNGVGSATGINFDKKAYTDFAFIFNSTEIVFGHIYKTDGTTTCLGGAGFAWNGSSYIPVTNKILLDSYVNRFYFGKISSVDVSGNEYERMIHAIYGIK